MRLKRFGMWCLGYFPVYFMVMIVAILIGLDVDTATGGWQAWFILVLGIFSGWKAGNDVESWYVRSKSRRESDGR